MLSEVVKIARGAGAEILSSYHQQKGVTYKADDSPLTLADEASHRFIIERLGALEPAIPVVSEESAELPERLPNRFWIVDPLDGTKEFIKKTGDFTVNIALVAGDHPVLGVVFAPAHGLLYVAEKGVGAFKQVGAEQRKRISVRRCSGAPVVAASRDHAGPMVQSLLEKLGNPTCVSMGSSLKFCLVAEGTADIYLRDLPTMEWDTAAAQCVVECAGGNVLELGGNPLRYRKESFRNPAILTLGDRSFDWTSWLPALGGGAGEERKT